MTFDHQSESNQPCCKTRRVQTMQALRRAAQHIEGWYWNFTRSASDAHVFFFRYIVLCAWLLWSEIFVRTSWLSVARHHHSSIVIVKTRLDKKLQVNAFSQGLVEIGYGLPRCLDFLMQGSFLVLWLRATVANMHGLWRTSCVEGFCIDASDVAYRNHLSTSNAFSCDRHSFVARTLMFCVAACTALTITVKLRRFCSSSVALFVFDFLDWSCKILFVKRKTFKMSCLQIMTHQIVAAITLHMLCKNMSVFDHRRCDLGHGGYTVLYSGIYLRIETCTSKEVKFATHCEIVGALCLVNFQDVMFPDCG